MTKLLKNFPPKSSKFPPRGEFPPRLRTPALGSMVYSINSGQTHKHTHNNCAFNISLTKVASQTLFVRIWYYATQLTAASRPFLPQKHTNNLIQL